MRPVCFFFKNWLMKHKNPNLIKPLDTTIHQNSQFYYPSEPFSFHHFNVRHPVEPSLTQVTARLFIGLVIGLGLKEGLVECATVFVKSWVILRIICNKVFQQVYNVICDSVLLPVSFICKCMIAFFPGLFCVCVISNLQ